VQPADVSPDMCGPEPTLTQILFSGTAKPEQTACTATVGRGEVGVVASH
jgi:hypothetical protein